MSLVADDRSSAVVSKSGLPIMLQKTFVFKPVRVDKAFVAKIWTAALAASSSLFGHFQEALGWAGKTYC